MSQPKEPRQHKEVVLEQKPWKCILVFDKITDKIIHRESTMDWSGAHVNEIISKFGLASQVTNQDPNNIGHVIIDDDCHGSSSCALYILNGQPKEQHDLELTCDAVDHDNDGMPDLEGDGQDTCNFAIRVKDHNTGNLVSFSGKALVQTDRGKILNSVSGMVNIVNGTGTFQLRSVAETVRLLRVFARMVEDDNITNDTRVAASRAVRMNFR